MTQYLYISHFFCLNNFIFPCFSIHRELIFTISDKLAALKTGPPNDFNSVDVNSQIAARRSNSETVDAFLNFFYIIELSRRRNTHLLNDIQYHFFPQICGQPYLSAHMFILLDYSTARNVFKCLLYFLHIYIIIAITLFFFLQKRITEVTTENVQITKVMQSMQQR